MITSISTMKAAKNKILEILMQKNDSPKNILPQDILVAFDIDMTITQPDHPAVYYPNLKQHSALYQEIMSTLTSAERDRKVTLTIQLIQQRLIEEQTPEIIRAIQKTGVQTIAFTASLAGPLFYSAQTSNSQHSSSTSTLPSASRIEELRYTHLQKQGISFENTFGPLDFKLDNIPAHNQQHPVFFKGILCANGELGKQSTKGDVLIAFLKKMNLRPKCICLIDDRMPNLTAVDQALKKDYPSIQFLGLEYQGAFNYAPQTISAQDFRSFWQNLAHRSKIS